MRWVLITCQKTLNIKTVVASPCYPCLDLVKAQVRPEGQPRLEPHLRRVHRSLPSANQAPSSITLACLHHVGAVPG